MERDINFKLLKKFLKKLLNVNDILIKTLFLHADAWHQHGQ
jgi:hypothetical protein